MSKPSKAPNIVLHADPRKVPSEYRLHLLRERTRIVKRIKAILARLGIPAFKFNLRKAAKNCRLCIRRKVCPYRNEAEPSCAVISDGR
ncbi:hypothetical protein X771_11530 [Mesorhizobium sp. LSJC277A00]|nr:hypothetical protein X771_11530 [Mesorhizobium sp. LSJC277A00]